MAGQKDFINILQEIRGTSAPGDPVTDGIWYELITADKNGNPGIYGDILAKYGLIDDAIQYLDVLATLEADIAALGPINQEIATVASEPLRGAVLDAGNNAATAEEAAIMAVSASTIAAAAANIDYAGFAVSDGELVVTYYDGSNSVPSLVDGELILTY